MTRSPLSLASRLVAPRGARPDGRAVVLRVALSRALCGALFPAVCLAAPPPEGCDDLAAGTPHIEVVPVPDTRHGEAIWGATGADAQGDLWFGVSAKHAGESARLLRFTPGADTWRDEGEAVDWLVRAGLNPPGAGQVKMHSRFVPGPAGWLYFTTMDEEGEREDGSARPRWGSHLWRIRPATGEREHLLASADALIAAGSGAGAVFALGYWDHVLYRYDTATGDVARVVVGSVGGHISRNLLVDARGSAYVPRVRRAADGSVEAALVAFDSRLVEIASTPLPGYVTAGDPAANHGITGLVRHPDGRLWFTTHTGRLYLVDARGAGPAQVTDLGPFHPDGERYAPSLFLDDDGTTLAGLVSRDGRFEWVARHIATGCTRVRPLDLSPLREVLLYGSVARDREGRFVLAGRYRDAGGRNRPLVVRVRVDAP